MAIICLMGVHSLKRAGSKHYSAAIAFTLALFSHLINHVNIRLQAELEEGENPVSAFQSDGTDEPESKEALEKRSQSLSLPLWYPKLMRAERAVSTPDSLVYVVAAATILLKLVMTVT